MKNGRIRPENPPPPTYAFGYRHPPRSGNEINGLGETTKRQARHVFHSAGGPPLDWQALDDFFGLLSPWSVLKHVIGNAWQLRNKDGPVSDTQRPVDDPVAMTAEIKDRARALGADGAERAGGVPFTRRDPACTVDAQPTGGGGGFTLSILAV